MGNALGLLRDKMLFRVIGQKEEGEDPK